MASMSREFALVLLGAGILTAGYFLWPEDNLEAKAQEQAQQQVAGNQGHHSGGHFFVWIHGGFGAPGAKAGAPSMAGVSRGGFGGTGHAASGLS
jgi:hypothetical protein